MFSFPSISDVLASSTAGVASLSTGFGGLIVLVVTFIVGIAGVVIFLKKFKGGVRHITRKA